MISICKGIPGSVPHRVSDPDELIAGICGACQASLFAAKGWGSQSNGEGIAESVVALRVAGGKKAKKNLNSHPVDPEFRGASNSGGSTLPGSPAFKTPKRKAAKQPWGMERK